MRIEALEWHAQSNWISLPVISNLICPAFSEDDSNAPDFFPPPAFSVYWEVLMHRMDLKPQDSCNNWTASVLSETQAWSNGSQKNSQTTDTDQYQAMAVHMYWSDRYKSVVMHYNEAHLKGPKTIVFLQTSLHYQSLAVVRVTEDP